MNQNINSTIKTVPISSHYFLFTILTHYSRDMHTMFNKYLCSGGILGQTFGGKFEYFNNFFEKVPFLLQCHKILLHMHNILMWRSVMKAYIA